MVGISNYRKFVISDKHRGVFIKKDYFEVRINFIVSKISKPYCVVMENLKKFFRKSNPYTSCSTTSYSETTNHNEKNFLKDACKTELHLRLNDITCRKTEQLIGKPNAKLS